jgi:hypothetical protein
MKIAVVDCGQIADAHVMEALIKQKQKYLY